MPGLAAALGVRVVELVELARVTVDDDHVPVAVGVAATLDWRIGWNRIRPLVRFVRVVERHVNLLLRLAEGGKRNADRPAVVETGAEVRMDAAGAADRANDRRRVLGDRQ